VKKAVLINPPAPDGKKWVREGRCQQWSIWGAPFPPMTLALLSTQLVREGVDTIIIDAGPEGKDLAVALKECRSFQPDLAILSVATPTVDSDLGWFAPKLKHALPGILIAAVGIHVSTLPRDTLAQYPCLDFALIGEPEHTITDLIQCLASGNNQPGDVPGIAFRDEQGHVHITRNRDFIDDLDAIGFPDWKKIDFGNYRLPITDRPFALISFSRGCPFHCTFCAASAYYGRVSRKRSVDSLIEEIKFNVSLGVTDFLFFTEVLTLDRRHLEQFLEALKAEGLERKIRWVCNSRTDTGDRSLFKKMREVGCRQIAFGFEFGADEILQLARKGTKHTTARGRQAAQDAASAGLVVDGHFILGFPGETEENLQATIDYACSMPLTFALFYAAVPFPGSQLYEEARCKGWVSGTEYREYNQDLACIRNGSLDPDVVSRFIRKAYRSFYLRPAIAWRLFRIPQSMKEFLRLGREGVDFSKRLV